MATPGQPKDPPGEDPLLGSLGASAPSFWSGVIDMQLTRLEEGADAHRRHIPHPDRVDSFDGFGASLTHDLGPMDADAYFLLVAVRHLLAIADRFADRYDRDQVNRARERFDAEAPDATALRDVLAHLDAYAVGEGRRDEYGAQGQFIIQLGLDFDRDEFDLRAGHLKVEVKRTARAAVQLARDLNEASAPRPLIEKPRNRGASAVKGGDASEPRA